MEKEVKRIQIDLDDATHKALTEHGKTLNMPLKPFIEYALMTGAGTLPWPPKKPVDVQELVEATLASKKPEPGSLSEFLDNCANNPFGGPMKSFIPRINDDITREIADLKEHFRVGERLTNKERGRAFDMGPRKSFNEVMQEMHEKLHAKGIAEAEAKEISRVIGILVRAHESAISKVEAQVDSAAMEALRREQQAVAAKHILRAYPLTPEDVLNQPSPSHQRISVILDGISYLKSDATIVGISNGDRATLMTVSACLRELHTAAMREIDEIHSGRINESARKQQQ